MGISLQTAQKMISAARAKGQEMGFKPLTVAVLDAGGHLVALEREDGSSTLRPDIAIGKAKGAISMGISLVGLTCRSMKEDQQRPSDEQKERDQKRFQARFEKAASQQRQSDQDNE